MITQVQATQFLELALQACLQDLERRTRIERTRDQYVGVHHDPQDLLRTLATAFAMSLRLRPAFRAAR